VGVVENVTSVGVSLDEDDRGSGHSRRCSWVEVVRAERTLWKDSVGEGSDDLLSFHD
jgi:hypothetical protein